MQQKIPRVATMGSKGRDYGHQRLPIARQVSRLFKRGRFVLPNGGAL